MYTLLVLLATIIAILLVVMVLLQASKGGGLAGTFGGAGMGTMFGSRRTADFLSKGTWWLAGALAVLALVINLFFLPGQTTTEQRSVIQEGGRTNVPTSPTLPPQNQAPSGK
ncbi:MAG: preprotein translocase subunit SecG [Ignavibacteriales bacterium]|jgi:preprotein translocase subunit SecG|nr:preprotein translocase subunit SecG [Ignavibacteriales bacterium]MBP9120162.1 preprotein translocase subunit SecG [Ignavibacterium sp.]RPI61353.1 MAG: preprotein translocase subunit SecG [Ignavibacteriales bacterium]